MRIGALTHPGLVREKNEDYFLVVKSETQEYFALIIADGMGGHNSGEVASFTAADYMAEFFKAKFSQINKDSANVDELLIQAVKEANRKVYDEAQESTSNTGMGTTLSFALVMGSHVKIGHVGDSRVYLFRDNNLEQLTRDHSYIEELLKAGSITKEEAKTHPRRNIITRALGNEDDVMPDIYTTDLLPGDILLMCTDGLTNMLDEIEISNTLRLGEEPEVICTKLVELANVKGGDDNVTVLAAIY